MFLIQIALTAVLVHIVASNQLRAELVKSALRGDPRLPVATAFVSRGAYWTAVVAGIAGIWTVV